MRHRKGKQRRKGWLRAAALLLTVCLLAGGLPAGGRAAAASEVLQHEVLQQENAAAYEIFLADFLSQDPRLRSDLSLEMLHRRLNTAMDEEEGFRESADAYLFLTDAGSLVFDSRQELYKQILLEILCKQAASGDTLEKTRESLEIWRDTILEYAVMALDYGPDVLSSDGTLRQVLAAASPQELQNAFLASTVYGVVQECYTENEDGVTLLRPVGVTLTEEGGTGSAAGSCLVIPAYVNGRPVTELDFQEAHQERLAGALGEPRYLAAYGSLPEGCTGQFALVLPDTVKRIDDGCFARCAFLGGIRFGSRVESIGERAFAEAAFYGAIAEAPDAYRLSPDTGESAALPAPSGTVLLPESVRSIGESAFEGADFQESSLVMQADVEAVPARCFAEAKNLAAASLLSPGLKRMEQEAFAGLTADTETGEAAAVASGQRAIALPDTVEFIGERAFAVEPGSRVTVQALPSSLRELGAQAFSGCRLEDASFPAELTAIPAKAFSEAQFELGEAAVRLQSIGAEAFWGAEMARVQLPDSLETIGACAFAGCTAKLVECFETEAALPQTGTIGECAFADCPNLTAAQLPAGITEMGADVYAGCTALQSLAWPAGLCSLEPQTFSGAGLYVTLRGEARTGEKGTLPEEAFVCEPGASLVYLELPGAFAGQLQLGAFDRLSERYYDLNHLAFDNSRRIRTLVMQGVPEETKPGEMAKEFADFVQQAAYAVDEEGNRVCLYERRPDSYTKVSRYCSEDSEAYQIEFPQESRLLTEQSFGELTDFSVRLNADEETAADLAEADFAVYRWYSESEATRALELEEFLEFEDLYLRQPQSCYYRIGVTVDGEEQFSHPGSYQVIFELPPEWDGASAAAYHIDPNGLITRLRGDFYNDGTTKEYRALSSDLGSFAVVSVTRLSEEVRGSFSEELHQLLDTAHREVGEDPVEFPMEGGMVSVVRPAEEGGEGTEPSGTVTVFRPEAEEPETGSAGDESQESGSGSGETDGAEAETLEIESTGEQIRLQIGLTDLEGRIPVVSRKPDGTEKSGDWLSFLPGRDGQVKAVPAARSGEAEEASGSTVWYEVVLEEPGRYQLRLADDPGWTAWFSEHPILTAGLALVLLLILKKLFGSKKRKRARGGKAG